MNQSIINFIEKQNCANIACVDAAGNPYCFSCFYSVNIKDGLLFFKSSADTNHMKIILENPVIAGTILPDKLQILTVKGIQFNGIILSQQDELSKNGNKHYYTKYPFALAVPGEIWTIQLNHIKMTDSSKGFGHKITWFKVETTFS